MTKTGLLRAGLAAALVAAPSAVLAHPHIWAEARVELAIDSGAVTGLQHVWRFDEYFSATVLVEFDKNADNALDENELAEVGKTVRDSIADFNYFQLVQQDGTDRDMEAPQAVIATMDEQKRLILLFESKLAEPLPLKGKLDFAVYDPTFYTAIDFMNDEDMVSAGLPATCSRSVIRPDPDEILAQNSANLTESFFETTDMTDLTGIFATRLELTFNDN